MNKNQLLNFEAFLKFSLDFSIFPDLVSKSKLNKYFKTTMSTDILFTDTAENDFIDQNIFVDILAQCAFEIPYRSPEPSNVEKVILFIKFFKVILFAEKISQSDGPNKVLKIYGQTRMPNGESLDILSIFKSTYPNYFNITETKKMGFFDILNNNL
jgi:hypothetical protein